MPRFSGNSRPMKKKYGRPRIKSPAGVRANYALTSATLGGEHWFGIPEREHLRTLIWRVCEFSGIKGITYTVMENHFSILVEVPPGREVSDGEMVRRFAMLYPEHTPWQPLTAEALAELLAENDVPGQALREELLARMHDISWLMKTIKQRFSTWFNRSRERFGPVWSKRFESVLLEDNIEALRTVAAYIDLTAMREGVVDDPKDYPFCGYAEAAAGNEAARRGLASLA